MEEQTQVPATSNSSYGKRPMWQWVVLYLVVGGLIYAAVYYLWLMPKGGYGTTNQDPQQNSPY